MQTFKRLFDILEIQKQKYNLSLSLITKYKGNWQATSSEQLINDIHNLSKALLDFGIKPNDKIAIITDRSRTEWHITDYAIMQIGAVNVPIYDSTSVYDMQYIFNHAEVKYCFVSNETLLNKVNSFKQNTPTLIDIFCFDKVANANNFKDVLFLGSKLNTDSDVNSIKNIINSNDLATIIYTSGTTDKPKGVMLSHNNIISNINALQKFLPVLNENPKSLSFLPVSHIFERMMIYLYQVNGISVYFAESIETISSDISIVKPEIITAVPRLIEKIHDRIIAKGKELGSIKRKLFNWALELGYKFEYDGINGKKYEKNLSRARKLIFKKWHEALGGNIKVIYCGSSKLAPKLMRIFGAAGFNLMDGYGLTETSPVVSGNSPHPNGAKIGTIGKPLHNLDVKIADDGEILVKGPSVMLGYYKDIEKTKQTIINGYFKTGDLGKLDSDGFLYITGRKKETFKTSGGKYISPDKIEIELKKSNLIEQVMVIGEGEKFPAAIIQPNFDFLKQWSATQKLNLKSNTNLIQNQQIIQLIQTEIDTVNQNLGQWEKIKKFELTPDEWTIKDGHLTPTLKVKKDIIKSKYYILFNKIYRPV